MLPSEIISCKEAKEKGLMRYFTGKVCPHGHVALRRITTRSCTECDKLWEKKRDPEKARIRGRTANWKRHGFPSPTRPRPICCELCGGPPTKRALHLDHDKRTGEFRGWLCHYCNTNLGRFGDTVEGLARAIKYLQGEIYVTL